MERSAKRAALTASEYAFPTQKLAEAAAEDARPAIALLEVGSFSPLTLMHLRVLEQVRDAARDRFQVLGGFLSPVGDAYEKKGLAPASHRVKMAQLATEDTEWLAVDEWESQQSEYVPTVRVVAHFRRQLEPLGVQVFLACGADLLKSFSNERAWKEEEIHGIFGDVGGIFVIEREGVDVQQVMFNTDILYAYRHKIHPVHQHVSNSISSTAVRRCVARGLSIKYLVHPAVEAYIREHQLYSDTQLEKKVSIFGGD